MTYQHHVFLSYKREDKALMSRVKEGLENANLIVWTDDNIYSDNASWKLAIETAIEASGCLLVILTPKVKLSEYIRKEISYAKTHNKAIFAFLAEGNERSSIPFDLTDHQLVDIRMNYDAGMQTMIRDIRKYLNIPEPKPITPPIADTKTIKPSSIPPPAQKPIQPKLSSPSVDTPPPQKPKPVSQETSVIKPLRPINPFDWAKLLWWILLDPEKWVAYRTAQSKRDFIGVEDEPTGIWLANTLVWLPLFWLTVGIAMNNLPISGSDFEIIRYVVFVMPFVWLLTVYLSLWKPEDSISGVVGVVVAVISAVISAVIVGVGVAGVVAYGMAGVVAYGMAGVVAYGMAGVVGVISAVISAVIVGVVVAGGVGVVVGVVVAVVVAGGVAVVIKSAIEQKSATWATILVFITLLASHAFLIWYCLMGGYQVIYPAR